MLLKNTLAKGLENKFYLVVVIVTACSTMFFFTSKIWLSDDKPVNQAAFNQAIGGLSQTEIILRQWQYNDKNQLMEVLLEREHVGSDTIKPSLAFAAKESQTYDTYPVEIVYQNSDYIVVHIKEVPKKYKQVGLFVKEVRDKKMVANDLQAQNIGDVDVEQQADKEAKEIILVGDYRELVVNSSLKKKDTVDYLLDFVRLEQEQLMKQITAIKDKHIPLQDEIIEGIETEIQLLSSDMEYKTESEKQELLQQILKKNQAIEKAQEKQDEYRKQIEELEQKKSMLDGKIAKIKSGS